MDGLSPHPQFVFQSKSPGDLFEDRVPKEVR